MQKVYKTVLCRTSLKGKDGFAIYANGYEVALMITGALGISEWRVLKRIIIVPSRRKLSQPWWSGGLRY